MFRGSFPRTIICRRIPTADASIRNAALIHLTEPPHLPGMLPATGPVYLLKDTGQESLLAARYGWRISKFRLRNASSNRTATKFPAGSWILSDAAGLHEAIRVGAPPNLGLEFTERCCRARCSAP